MPAELAEVFELKIVTALLCSALRFLSYVLSTDMLLICVPLGPTATFVVVRSLPFMNWHFTGTEIIL